MNKYFLVSTDWETFTGIKYLMESRMSCENTADFLNAFSDHLIWWSCAVGA